ncbi:F0F1 ATP synthase subunit A [Anatilimnocola floriformis]|uniref:F0F1 ATP synthase subunit A n=1 Tax=Anatilimnocola floriformis TaxID=2948575 RepID=UPI0020C46B70|nr:F0F1 ATP synthase subunit A [Anatilimnocola floriformis]
MADPVLHIKDAYFFEIPKKLWPRAFNTKQQVADVSKVWVELDDQFQDYEFHKQYHALEGLGVKLPSEDEAHDAWHNWVHPHDAHGHGDHHAAGHHGPNFGKPFDEFLNSKVAVRKTEFATWKSQKVQAASKLRSEDIRDANDLKYGDYQKADGFKTDAFDPFVDKMLTDAEFPAKWEEAKVAAADVAGFVKDESAETKWSDQKLADYSEHLSGKILIPQPFGRLRNLHEPEAGQLTITKYMIVEVAVALLIAIFFSWLARRVISGAAPKGRMWNFLEVFVVFIRDQIAVPAIGDGHHDEHPNDHHHSGDAASVDAGGHAIAAAANAGPGLGGNGHDHGHAGHGHGKKDHAHVSPAKKFTPLLCTIFFFVLGCNLAGMLPWIGAPTSTWGVTLALALVTFSAVVISGMAQFGFLGFFANQIPSMDMPWYMAIVLKPAIFLIEFGGLLIKHAVLSVRLLANMVAGHLVLLAIMALAFGAEAASQFTVDGSVSPMWWVAAGASILGCTLLSLLELFVAFLQAYVFTLLSALFIGAAIHKH